MPRPGLFMRSLQGHARAARAARLALLALLVTGTLGVVPQASEAGAQETRYFGIWGYLENAPEEEIASGALSERKLGYWAVEFDAEGHTVQAVYHGVNGVRWLSFVYVEEAGRVYADLFGSDGAYLRRKSTTLVTRAPSWPERD